VAAGHVRWRPCRRAVARPLGVRAGQWEDEVGRVSYDGERASCDDEGGGRDAQPSRRASPSDRSGTTSRVGSHASDSEPGAHPILLPAWGGRERIRFMVCGGYSLVYYLYWAGLF